MEISLSFSLFFPFILCIFLLFIIHHDFLLLLYLEDMLKYFFFVKLIEIGLI